MTFVNSVNDDSVVVENQLDMPISENVDVQSPAMAWQNGSMSATVKVRLEFLILVGAVSGRVSTMER